MQNEEIHSWFPCPSTEQCDDHQGVPNNKMSAAASADASSAVSADASSAYRNGWVLMFF